MAQNSPNWTDTQLRAELKNFNYWYHKISLSDEVVTPGMDLEPIWLHIEDTMRSLDYHGKTVLDIAAFDGKFSFFAEKLGAHEVVATDCLYKSFKNFLFCREVLKSEVIPFFNVSPYNLVERLDVYFDENYDEQIQNNRHFDIVQHFGLLYHLQNPLWSILQARSVLKTGGLLILETDCVLNSNESVLVFNGLPLGARVRNNSSVWWAPTKRSLSEMISSCLFEIVSVSELDFSVPVTDGGKIISGQQRHGESNYNVGRCLVVAKATESLQGDETQKVRREIFRTYRNPGLDLRRLSKSS